MIISLCKTLYNDFLFYEIDILFYLCYKYLWVINMEIEKIHTLWREKQGFVLERNRDEDYYVFIHFLSNVKLKDGEAVKAGACIMYKPFSYRYFHSDSQPLIHDWFHVRGNINEITDKYGIELNKFYYPYNDHEITSIVQELELETLISAPFSNEIRSLKIEELIAKIARGSKHLIQTDSITYERFLQLRSFMQSKYNEIQNVESLASMVGLSPSRFYVLYKKIFDISPKQDLLNIRIEHAKLLLYQNRHTISEIAEITGYTNPFHFIRQFKLKTGKSPLQFSKTL